MNRIIEIGRLKGKEHGARRSRAGFGTEVLTAKPSARLIAWGGECRDLAALRKTAGEFGLLLSRQLRGLPYSAKRLDLCKQS